MFSILINPDTPKATANNNMPYSTAPMKKLEHKSLVTAPYNLTYSYYLSPNFHQNLDRSVATLVFAHGFPDDAHMWAGTLPIFLELPYPFIVLDLLGFDGSSKPVETSRYNYRNQANSIAQILGQERVPNNVILIGHDWGSANSQRFYLYHKEQCIGLCLLSLAYQVPSPQPFNLDEANRLTTQRFGYPQWEYWNFFTSPDAPELMRMNIERFFEINHGFIPDEDGKDIQMREFFCVPGAMRDYVTQTGRWKNKKVELKRYAKENPGIFQRFAERLCRDGLEAPNQYYHALKNNTMLEDEQLLCEQENGRKIEVPLLYIGQTGDWVCRTDLMQDAVEEGLVQDLEEKVIDAGHWVLYEKPEEVAHTIKEWLLRRFPVKV